MIFLYLLIPPLPSSWFLLLGLAAVSCVHPPPGETYWATLVPPLLPHLTLPSSLLKPEERMEEAKSGLQPPDPRHKKPHLSQAITGVETLHFLMENNH